MLAIHRLLNHGGEWRQHRLRFEQSAIDDLPSVDVRLMENKTLYRYFDKTVLHKRSAVPSSDRALARPLQRPIRYPTQDLTSPSFESPPPEGESDEFRYGSNRDKRSDCAQPVIAWVVTPDGFPLAYEVLSGNTADKITLKRFLQKIETQYGKAERIWMMDRSISIEEALEDRQVDDPSICCLVDTPKGRLTKLERDFLHLSWATVRQVVNGNLLPKEGQRSLFVESRDRIYKKLAMRRRLKSLVNQLKLLDLMRFNDRRSLLFKLGAANRRRWTTWTLMKIILPQPATSDTLFDEKASGVTPHRGVSSTTHDLRLRSHLFLSP